MSVTGIVAAFNLVCSGVVMSGVRDDPDMINRKTPFQETFRVDLLKKRWCSGACLTTQPIAKIQDTIITLQQEDYTGVENFVAVNRENGSFVAFSQTRIFLERRTGSCKRAKFGGFPSRKF